ncbi:MAG: hypothetical protein BGP14_03120 [Sphingobacteriales bacterium 44-15]|nr:MAG: hypothetical protein BGP14_03120 [Sphingobacteriales bacterium 44-15]
MGPARTMFSRAGTIAVNLSPEGLNLGVKMSKFLLNPVGVQCKIAANIPPVTSPTALGTIQIKPLSGYLSVQIL